MSLKAGVGRAVITPPLTLPHAGWGAQTHMLAKGVEADLWSTVLVLSEKETKAVIVDLDVCSLTPVQSDEMRSRIATAVGTDHASIRISNTHTHAGPYLWTDYYEEKKPIRLSYLEHIMEQTVEAAIYANGHLAAVTVGAGFGSCGISANRRQVMEDGRVICGVQEDGFTDPRVSVVRFDDSEGNVLCSLVHYSMHATILGPANQLMSPDYPGALKRTVEANVGGKCLFLQGAAGDIGPGAIGYTDDIGKMRTAGRIIGCTASAVLLETDTYRTETKFTGIVESGASLGYWTHAKLGPNNSTLKVMSRVIRFDVRPTSPPEQERAAAEAMRSRLHRLQNGQGTETEIKETMYKLKRLMMAADHAELYYGVPYKEVEAQYIRIGDVVLIGLPLEPFAKIGMQIRERSPFPHTFFSGYTNGWEGYFPTTDAYPGGGYEVETTPFAPGSEQKLVEEVLAALQQLIRD